MTKETKSKRRRNENKKTTTRLSKKEKTTKTQEETTKTESPRHLQVRNLKQRRSDSTKRKKREALNDEIR